jgi:hypothetical protein
MPANPKYLTKSPWLRLAKITIGFAGGYAVMLSLHLLLAQVFPPQNVAATAFFTGYLLWALLLLWAFVAKKVWQVGLTYIGLTLLFTLPRLLL